jgi:uncharacterized coiled-coil DUF342 family protein
MTQRQRTSEIESISQQIEKIREQANLGKDQIKKYVERRNQLNDQVKKAHKEIYELKSERDTINNKVKLLKQQRDSIRTKSAPIMNELNLIKLKISKLKKNVPRDSQRDLQNELNAIEWKIQTSVLDLQEEKRLVENVKHLETRLSSYKKINLQNKKIKDLLTQRTTFEAQADALHKELTELAKKSQELHSDMIEKINTMKNSKAEADSLHHAYIETKKQLAALYEKIQELAEQLKNFKVIIKEEDKAKKIAIEQAIKEKLETEAKNKLKRGEKLSWNEFQLVMNDDAQDKPETQD